MKIVAFLISFCLWQSWANVIFRGIFNIGSGSTPGRHNPSLRTTTSPLVPREDNDGVCRPPSRPLLNARRDIGISQTRHNVTLFERAMLVPAQGEEEGFIMEQTKSEETYPLVWDVDNPPDLNGGERTQYDVNTATFKKFTDKTISLSTMDLHGCSALAIISRKGVYMTHYWESIAYRPDEDDLKGTTQAALFEKYVLAGLREGIKGPKITEQVSLRDNAQALEDDNTHAFLIHPAPNPANRNGYQVEAQKIRAVVEEYLPKIKSSGRFTLVPYTVEPNEQVRMTTSAGRALFQYEPKEAEPPRRGYMTAKLMLWSETTIIHEDSWDYSRRG